MYYLYSPAHDVMVPTFRKMDGTVIPGRKIPVDARTIYKTGGPFMFKRGPFLGLKAKHNGMKPYTSKTLKKILEIRQIVFEATGELFEVYDENGRVELPGGN